MPFRPDFPGLFCFTFKLNPIQPPFQCNWDTNPCHCSYQRPRISMKKLHYIFLIFYLFFSSASFGFSLSRPSPQYGPLWPAKCLCWPGFLLGESGNRGLDNASSTSCSGLLLHLIAERPLSCHRLPTSLPQARPLKKMKKQQQRSTGKYKPAR